MKPIPLPRIDLQPLDDRMLSEFSVLMAVYGRDKAGELDQALESLVIQTAHPSQVVMVVDGPIPSSLESVLEKYRGPLLPMEVCRLADPSGLAKALDVGLERCQNELVARMDSDDISLSNRFELQLECFRKQRALTVVGGAIEEFRETPGDLKRLRIVPEESESIRKFARWRCPFNHQTVMYRRSHVLAVGGYGNIFPEDYFLWAKLLLAGCKLINMKEKLAYARVGNDMIRRRSGYAYFRSEIHLLSALWKIGFFDLREFILAMVTRTPIRLLPQRFLEHIYSKYLRHH